MTEYTPLIFIQDLNVDDPSEIEALKETVKEQGLTHVRLKKGKKIEQEIYPLRSFDSILKKSVATDTIGPGDQYQRFPYTRVESLGVMGSLTTEEEAPAKPDTKPAEEKPPRSHKERAHAILSASSANRWLNCPPSALINAQAERKESDAAKQGTAAHELAEWKIHNELIAGGDEKRPFPKTVDPWHDEEMERHTNAYLAFVSEALDNLKDQGAELLLEQRLDFSTWVPEGFGTGDAVIIADNVIHVIDLKYGEGIVVDAVENPQLALYGLGAIATFGDLYDLDTVKLTIFQPRRDNISTWETTVEDLLAWGEETVKPAAELAIEGEGEYKPGSWCQWCHIRSTCRARAEENLALAKAEFAQPTELTDDELAEIMQQIPKFKKWASDVEKFMTAQAVDHGKHYNGLKVVAGRSIRKYIDEQKVADAATAAGYRDIFDKKLIGITAMEKYLGKKTFQEVLGELVHKPAGKPMLVPESDKRPAIKIGAEADFEDLDQGAA